MVERIDKLWETHEGFCLDFKELWRASYFVYLTKTLTSAFCNAERVYEKPWICRRDKNYRPEYKSSTHDTIRLSIALFLKGWKEGCHLSRISNIISKCSNQSDGHKLESILELKPEAPFEQWLEPTVRFMSQIHGWCITNGPNSAPITNHRDSSSCILWITRIQLYRIGISQL